MLSVGRELNLAREIIICRPCAWEGGKTLLQKGLFPVLHREIYIYAYRCPACGSFDLGIKGKLLFYKPRNDAACEPQASDEINPQADYNGTIEKRHSR